MFITESLSVIDNLSKTNEIFILLDPNILYGRFNSSSSPIQTHLAVYGGQFYDDQAQSSITFNLYTWGGQRWVTIPFVYFENQVIRYFSVN